MPELITTHTHTGFTNHGFGTIDELVSAAQDAGITTIAITEHYPLTSAFDFDDYVSMNKKRVPEYLADIKQAQQDYPDIEIIAGTELDWLGADEDRVFAEDEFKPFGLVLGSVHFVDTWAFDDPKQRHRWEELGADAIWRRYFEIWCDAVTSKAPFTVMAHPDLAKKFGIYPSFDLAPLYDQAAEACAAGGRMIEVNTSGVTYACNEMFPAPALLRRFCEAGIPCTVGTDAHRPEHVARGIEEGYKLMYEAGYRKVTVPTSDGDRREIQL